MTERSAVQDPLLRYAEAIGWERVAPAKALALRGGEDGLFFGPVLVAQLARLNPGVVDDAQAAAIVRQLSLLPPTIAGNRDALAWLRGERSVFDPAERRERNVRLLDFERPANNLFQVTDEWAYKGLVHRNRADVVFLINGIPVAIAETKAAGKPNALAEGVEQIRRYHRETPQLFIAPQLFEVTQLLDFFYGVTWNTGRKALFNWRDETPGEDFEARVRAFFDPARLLGVLRDQIIFLTKDDDLTKIILRQHQTRAVERVLDRIADPRRRRGLVWHTQGSGKTLTMLTVAARLLRDVPGGEKPTVLMIVDRTELETQLSQNIAAYGLAGVAIAETKHDLRRLLAADYRGLIVSMIHKFDRADANLNTRPGVVVLVDEAHRTTGGDLGNYLLGALPQATYIGFTGTPIDRLHKGQGTFKVFGPDDNRGYLDKYSIAESIQDGTTVRLNYALAPSDLRVARETLERQFLGLADAEGISDIEELNAILDRAVELKELMKAPGRIDRIARVVAEHFRDNVEPLGFKAFLVAVDREACALYKAALDRYLPPEESAVIYSSLHNDRAELTAHALTADREKEIRKAFVRKGTAPKILIVTDKLLTGFDAPILYALYLDKPMRDHVLLQAIARVNRPYEDEGGQSKAFGLVFDFVGIFERLEAALAFDSDEVAATIANIDVLKDLFGRMMRETAGPYLAAPAPPAPAAPAAPGRILREATPAYLPLTRGWDDKAKERAVEHFADRARREAFYRFFGQLQNLYDILSPDAALRPHVEDYGALAELYALVRSAYSQRVYVDREVTAKTRALLREHTVGDGLALPGALHELGPQELAALKRGAYGATSKILNLRKVLATTVEREGASKPFLTSIGERAEALAASYEDRQLTTRQALAAFEELAQEYVEADADRQRLGLGENAFAIYRELRGHTGTAAVAQSAQLDALIARFPDASWNAGQGSRLRGELYKALRPLVGMEALIPTANAILRLRRV